MQPPPRSKKEREQPFEVPKIAGLSISEGAYTAYSASREGYRHLELLHRMNVCRQSEAAWTASGDPAGYHAWLDASGKIPFDFRQGGNMHPPCFLLPCRYGPPPNAQVLEASGEMTQAELDTIRRLNGG